MRDLGALIEDAEPGAANPAQPVETEPAQPAEEANDAVVEAEGEAPAVEEPVVAAAPADPEPVVAEIPDEPEPVVEAAEPVVEAVEPDPLDDLLAGLIADDEETPEAPAAEPEPETPVAAAAEPEDEPEIIQAAIEDEPAVEEDDEEETPVVAILDEPGPAGDEAPATAAVAEPEPELTELEKTVQAIAEMEANRRAMLSQYGYERLAAGKEALNKDDYKTAKEQFDLALAYIGDENAANIAAREELRLLSQETLYKHARLLFRQNDLPTALVLAQQAREKGHPRAPRLVATIQNLIDNPPQPKVQIVGNRTVSPEYLELQDKINRGMKRARIYYGIREYDKAREEAEKVLLLDPFNSEALTLRGNVGSREAQIRQIEWDATRKNMLAEVDAKKSTPERYALEAKKFSIEVTSFGDEGGGRDAQDKLAVEKKLQDIIIPEVTFRDANIKDVVNFLQESSREYDDQSLPVERRGVNFALKPSASRGAAPRVSDPFANVLGGGGDSDSPPINLTIYYSSLSAVLDTVMNLANMKYFIRGNIVTIVDINEPIDDLVTRSYTVLPTVLEVATRINQDIQPAAGAGGGGTIFDTPTPSANPAENMELKSAFEILGVPFPNGSAITYISAIGKMRVTNTPENLAKFEQTLNELNVQPYMVEIEARFVEVSQTDLNSLGFEWSVDGSFGLLRNIGNVGTGYLTSGGKFSGAVGNLVTWSPNSPGRASDGSLIGNISRANRFLSNSEIDGINNKLPIGSIGPTGPIADDIFNLTTTINGQDVGVIIHMLAQKTGTDLLSAPKVLTKPDQLAIMKVTREYIYPREYTVDTADASGDNDNVQDTKPYVEPGDFNFDEPTDVGVILEVTPTVDREFNLISMDLNPRVVELYEWRDYGYEYPTREDETPYWLKMEVPIFSRREVHANISIYNGATVVMGGMITEVRTKVEDKIPFFGDIPYIGNAFRSTIDRTEKRNLLIFVTAKLVDAVGRPINTSGEVLGLE